MKAIIKTYDTEEEWKDARKGVITGTRAGNILSKRDGKPLKGYYELLAERIATTEEEAPEGENAMDRGKRLEEVAVEMFNKDTQKKAKHQTNTIVVRSDNKNIGYSPDALIGKKEDVEVKCLNSADHLKAYITRTVPDEYMSQILQGFVVNNSLKTRYMVFFDNRLPKPLDFFYLTIKREDYEEDIKEVTEQQNEVSKQIEDILVTLTF